LDAPVELSSGETVWVVEGKEEPGVGLWVEDGEMLWSEAAGVGASL